MREQTKYTLGAIALFACSFIEAGDGCILWALLLFILCVGSIWHALHLWIEAQEAQWAAYHNEAVAQAIYHATVYPEEE